VWPSSYAATMNPPVDAYAFIKNNSAVLKVFGCWPSFHDGEVHRVVMDRARRHANGTYYPSIELTIRGWNMTSDVTEDGFYRLEADSLVHFLFEEVSEVEFDGLNHQNVLSGLDFELETPDEGNTPLLSVELCHCYGLSGSFKARRATVVGVAPFAEQPVSSPNS
jgi:hypothetical protein